MISALVASIVIGIQPAQVPKLDISNPGVSLRNLVPVIEKQTGWKVTLSPEVENEVIVLRTAGRPTEEVISKIAETTSTIWEIKGEYLTIRANTVARQQAVAKREAEFWETIAVRRDQYLESVKPRQEVDDEGVSYTVTPTPSEYYCANLLRFLTIDRIRFLKPDQRVVFALNPNQMQQRLTVLSQGLPNELTDEFLKFYSVPDKDMELMKENMELQQLLKLYGKSLEQYIFELQSKKPIKLMFEVSRRGFSSVNCILFACSSSGAKYEIDWLNLFIEESDIAPEKKVSVENREGDSIQLTPSEDEKAISALVKLPARDKINHVLSKHLLNVITHPDKFEPLRYKLGNTLLQAAEKLEIPIVSALSDYASAFNMLNATDIRVLRQILKEWDYEDNMKNGWWIVKPGDEINNWEGIVDRRRLEVLLNSQGKSDADKFDSIAKFEFDFPWHLYCFYPLYSFFIPEFFNIDYESEPLLRVFGGLRDAQRDSLRNGHKIPVSQLPTSVLEIMYSQIFGADGEVLHLPIYTQSSVVNGVIGEYLEDYNYWFDGISEVTELFPLSIPKDSFLSMTVEHGYYLQPVTSDLSLAHSVPKLTRDSLLSYFMMSSTPLETRYKSNPIYSRLLLGESTDIELRITLQPGIGLRGVFHQFSEPDRTRVFDLSNLPDEFSKMLHKDLDSLAENQFGRFLLDQRSKENPPNRTQPPPFNEL